MKVKLEIFDQLKKVTYYTIRLNSDKKTEIEKFVDRFQNSDYKFDLDVILTLLKIIGNERGAQDRFFRPEKQAHALPSRNALNSINAKSTDFPLRLYYIRLNDQIVILGGGGVKESLLYQNSPDCYPHIQRLLKFNDVFTEAV